MNGQKWITQRKEEDYSALPELLHVELRYLKSPFGQLNDGLLILRVHLHAVELRDPSIDEAPSRIEDGSTYETLRAPEVPVLVMYEDLNVMLDDHERYHHKDRNGIAGMDDVWWAVVGLTGFPHQETGVSASGNGRSAGCPCATCFP